MGMPDVFPGGRLGSTCRWRLSRRGHLRRLTRLSGLPWNSPLFHIRRLHWSFVYWINIHGLALRIACCGLAGSASGTFPCSAARTRCPQGLNKLTGGELRSRRGGGARRGCSRRRPDENARDSSRNRLQRAARCACGARSPDRGSKKRRTLGRHGSYVWGEGEPTHPAVA